MRTFFLFTVAEAYKTISSTGYGEAIGICIEDQGVGGCEIRSVVVNTSIVDFFPLLSFTLIKVRGFLQIHALSS